MKSYTRRFLYSITILTMFALSVNLALAEIYTYDAQGRLTSVVYNDGSSITYTYDAAGNITQREVDDGIIDLCGADPFKVAPGLCGCGVADTDTDGDGVADCEVNRIGNLSQQITAFLASREITKTSIATSLQASLSNASKKLVNKKNKHAARGILGALVNKLNAFVKGGKITAHVRDTLVPRIEELIASLA